MEKLSALRDKMHSALDHVKNKDIITFHEAFPYFAEEFGLHIAAVINREPDSQPSAKELADTIRLVRETGVKALFVEPLYPETSADIIAAEDVYKRQVEKEIKGDGNGRLDAVSNTIKENLGIQYQDLTYTCLLYTSPSPRCWFRTALSM